MSRAHAIAAGMPRTAARPDAPLWAGEPFGDSVLGDLTGRVEFTASRATLTPSLVGSSVARGARIEPGETAIENLEGRARRRTRRADNWCWLAQRTAWVCARGLRLRAAMPQRFCRARGRRRSTGRIALQAEVEGSGLSPASLVGSLNGTGMLTLEDAQISGLDPKAFNAAIRTVDQGLAVDAARIRDIVATVLDGGRLAVPRLDAAVTINAGQASIGHTTVLGQGADLALSGNADLADASIDARLTLAGPVISEGTSSMRPEILVSLKGPYAAPKRIVDVSALSGWLMLRSVERQAKQINAIEAERRREAEKRGCRTARGGETGSRAARRRGQGRDQLDSGRASGAADHGRSISARSAPAADNPSVAAKAARSRTGACLTAAAEYRTCAGRDQIGATATSRQCRGRRRNPRYRLRARRSKRYSGCSADIITGRPPVSRPGVLPTPDPPPCAR